MNTKTKLTRFVFALLLTLSALGISTTAALADRPLKYDVTLTDMYAVLTDVCPFAVEVYSTIHVAGIDFVDASGILIRTNAHIVGQDRFEANGKTLTGVPFTWNLEVYYDSSGNITRFLVNGIVDKVLLPGGGVFNPAGRTDLSATPFATFLTPDKGNIGNIDGFCAALAP